MPFTARFFDCIELGEAEEDGPGTSPDSADLFLTANDLRKLNEGENSWERPQLPLSSDGI